MTPLRIRVAEWLCHKLDFYIMDWYYEQERKGMEGMATNWDDFEEVIDDEDYAKMSDAEWDAYWQRLDDELEAMREGKYNGTNSA